MEEPRTTALPHPGGTVPDSRGGFKDAFLAHAAHAKPPPHGRGSRRDAGPQLGLAARPQPPRHQTASRDPAATPSPPIHLPFIFLEDLLKQIDASPSRTAKGLSSSLKLSFTSFTRSRCTYELY